MNPAAYTAAQARAEAHKARKAAQPSHLSAQQPALEPAWMNELAPTPVAEPAAVPAGQLGTAEQAVRFVLGGNATFTVVSKVTGTRYTYKVTIAPRKEGYDPVHFVSLLAGPDNENDFQYLGLLNNCISYRTTSKSRMVGSRPQLAFAWLWDKLMHGHMPANVEVWHEGRCGRCGRKLTVPSSVASGFGPECAGMM